MRWLFGPDDHGGRDDRPAGGCHADLIDADDARRAGAPERGARNERWGLDGAHSALSGLAERYARASVRAGYRSDPVDLDGVVAAGARAQSGYRGSSSALPQGRGLADPLAQEVQLGPANLAVADDLDLLDPRAVDLERPLDADAARDLADGDGAGDPAAAEAHDVALEDLDSLLAALDDARDDADGVARGEGREVGADLVGDDLVEHVHGGGSLIVWAARRCRMSNGCGWSGPTGGGV